MASAFAATPSAVPRKTYKRPAGNAARTGWDFQAPDRSGLNARWRESISATLQRTTFAPAAPAGRYLRHSGAATGKRLPPVRIKDLDKLRPAENRQLMLGGKTPIRGAFTKESTGWRPYNSLADTSGATPALKEGHRAGAYADFHPGEDVDLQVGPEYHLGTSALRPEQTGGAKDSGGALGMGMRLKIDF